MTGLSHRAEMRLIRKLSKDQFIEVASLILSMSVAQLTRVAKDEDTPALKAMVCSVALGIIAKGDMLTLNLLLDRLLGKVTDKLDINAQINDPAALNMTQEERVKEIEKFRKIREAVSGYDF